MVTNSTPKASRPDGTKERARLIKLIHVGRRELAIDDDTWRAYLRQAFLVESSTQLSLPRLKTALNHLRRQGFAQKGKVHEWSWVDTATPSRQPLLRKIIMLMKATGVESGNQVAYVEGIAAQMAGLNASAATQATTHAPLRMCDEVDLKRIVAALATHLNRRKAATAAPAPESAERING